MYEISMYCNLLIICCLSVASLTLLSDAAHNDLRLSYQNPLSAGCVQRWLLCSNQSRNFCVVIVHISETIILSLFFLDFQPDLDLFQRCSLTRNLREWILTLHDIDDNAPFLPDGIALPDISLVTACDSKNYSSAIVPSTKPLFDQLFLEELQL